MTEVKPYTSTELLTWLNHHLPLLQEQYAGQYLAYNAHELLFHGQDLGQVLEQAQSCGQPFAIYFVPRRCADIVILPIRIRSLRRHQWIPNYPVQLLHQHVNLATTMLVDSGADFSVISLRMGQQLGYCLADAELKLEAEGLGGVAAFVFRQVTMMIDGHSVLAPVAWLQQEHQNIEELILGREVVFDQFNIEFRQAQEQIIFTWATQDFTPVCARDT